MGAVVAGGDLEAVVAANRVASVAARVRMLGFMVGIGAGGNECRVIMMG